ncbi:TetR family transcriptional regulator [Desulfobulbus sp.]|uniref:TetR family transcriptional regulator n=1 Tax=Desulfobulbus sp. TaxID=895 RepID=UPI00286F368E|nr:TetR family transcriptional regulator [Desulfobulbus sp.]
MARKTKQEAQATRNSIVDAAVRVFAVKGVARTSLDDIAREAGVTRGAIYWHFANKADLLNALWDQIMLLYAPMTQASEAEDEPDPLGKMKDLYLTFFSGLVEDQRQQQLFRVLFDDSGRSKESEAMRLRHIQIRRERLHGIQITLINAKAKGQLPPNLDVRQGAISVLVFIYGLIASWITTPEMFDIKKEGEQFIEGMFQMLRTGFPENG